MTENKTVNKNDEITIKIDSMSSEGQGVGHHEGMAVFIPGTIPGETVVTRIIKVEKRFAIGKTLEIIERSLERVEAPCPVFGKCGGCVLQHVSYDAQLKFKRQIVVDALRRIGGFTDADSITHTCVGMDDPWRYRNKAAFPAAMAQNAASTNAKPSNAASSDAEPFIALSSNAKSSDTLSPNALSSDVMSPVAVQFNAVSSDAKSSVALSSDAKPFIALSSNVKSSDAISPNSMSPATISKEGKLYLGMFAHRSHRVVQISDCLIQDEKSVAALNIVEKWAVQHGIRAFDEKTGKGFLRHVFVRSSSLGHCMVVIISNTSKKAPLPHADQLVEALKMGVDGFSSLIHMHNDRRDNVILGEQLEVVWGKDSIDELIGGLVFEVSAHTFLQVNSVQTEKLYELAVDAACLTGRETVADLYCGMGSLSLALARNAKKIVGIEIVTQAVENANRNAIRNGILNAEFVCAAAEKELPRLVSAGESFDVVVLDPPRKGCDAELLDSAAIAGASRIVYVSCNPASLARDCAILANHGYKLISAKPVDMFPHTNHVETVALMVR